MCVIAHVPAGKALLKEQVEKMWKQNPDGGGFAYLNNQDEWIIRKFMKFDEWWRAYSGTQPNFKHRDFMVHFRIATHGYVDLDNTHPFVVDDHTIMAHNGVIGCVQDYKDGRSDTRVFVEETLPKLPKGWLDIPELRWLVEDGSNSKLLFYTKDPDLSSKVYILDEKGGTWEEEIWYSNLYWKTGGAKLGFSMYDDRWTEDLHVRGAWYPQTGSAHPVGALGTGAISGYEVVMQRHQAREKLDQLRADLGYLKEIGDISGEWMCWGCDSAVDPSGECECHYLGCLDCTQTANNCVCPNGWSANLVDIFDEEVFAELPLELQEAFQQAL